MVLVLKSCRNEKERAGGQCDCSKQGEAVWFRAGDPGEEGRRRGVGSKVNPTSRLRGI